MKEREYHPNRICGRIVNGKECNGRLIRFGKREMDNWKCNQCNYHYSFGFGEKDRYRFEKVES